MSMGLTGFTPQMFESSSNSSCGCMPVWKAGDLELCMA